VCLSELGEAEAGDPLDWLRNALPGEPGQDYPIHAAIKETSFSCSGKVFGGYYADQEQQCQTYHVCLKDGLDPSSMFPVTFLCPNGTLFNQEVFVCDWWFNVDCNLAANLYEGVLGAFGGLEYSGDSPSPTCPQPPSQPSCPAFPAGSQCWSPGQRDTDCPNNGLCCFDGCANTCLSSEPPPSLREPVGAGAEAKPAALPPPNTSTTTNTISTTESTIIPKTSTLRTTKSTSTTMLKTTTNPPTRTTTKAVPPVPKEGYLYPVPEIPFELPKPSPPPPGVPTLYGPPPI